MRPLIERRTLLPVAGGAALILATLVLVGAPQTPARVARLGEAPLRERLLRFEDAPDGAVLVHDARDGQLLQRFPAAEGGFVRGALRALVRERRQEELGAEAPFRVAAWTDGQLTLEDTATGRVVDLTAFGMTNATVFSQLLNTQGENR
jgi:putative photosynthetic complex assembly protein